MMEERKSYGELISLYTYEVDIKDVYVEGVIDRELISWFFRSHGKADVNIYEIDVVDIDDSILTKYDLDPGSKRSRLMALAIELSRGLSSKPNVICLVDRDNEDYIPTGLSSPLIEFTDYNSMEMYFFNEETIQKFISLVLGGFSVSSTGLISSMLPVLEEIYLIRIANISLRWNMEWIQLSRYVQCKGAVKFDRDAFTKAYLQKNGKWQNRTIFEKELNRLRSLLDKDPRKRIRGHDMIDILHMILTKMKPKRKFGDAETLRGALAGCIEAGNLAC